MEDANCNVIESVLVAAFMAHRAQLARFLRLRCGEEGVEDILHELWLKAQAVDTLIDRPLPYLYRMADRLVLDGRRGVARARTRDGDWAYIHERLSETAVQPTAERTLIARERLEATVAALNGVSERATRIFRRFRIDGLSQLAIAEELGISVSTVEKDLRKAYDALLTLRERFDEE